MHLYTFLKARNAFNPGTTASAILILFMLTMMFAPFIVRLSEKNGFDISARIMSYIGYTWMGLIFLFFTSSIALDFFRIIVNTAEFITKKNFYYLKPAAGFSFSAAFLLAALISIYGYFEADNIRTEKLIIKTSKLSEQTGNLRIVQISDIHIGLIVREERLKKILTEVRTANPDILVSTGDLVDGQINNLTGFSEFFREINPRYGKFAITGNHEFYAGLSQSLDFTGKAGFTILRGQVISIDGLINIAGVDDPAGRNYSLLKGASEKELLSQSSGKNFTLLLKHRPVVDSDSIGLFDLQLSGHSHKGQIFPFSLITKFYYAANAGYSSLTNNSHLYVSRGAGTWGPPIRFLSPPEITVIDVVYENVNFIDNR
ncbi:MAG: metallophosphoesterase [Nitrospirota bacterium]